MIQKDALQYLVESTTTRRFEPDQAPAFSRPVFRAPRMPPDPLPQTLDVWTLAAVAAYLKENRDDLELDRHVVHVHGPHCVTLEGPLRGEHRHRETPIRCSLDPSRWTLSDPMQLSLPEAITALQAMPIDGRHESHEQTREILLDFKTEESELYEDDGVAQRVKTERGGTSAWARLPKPHTILRPWRTFPEAVQPASPYVVRIDTSGGEPRISFHLADGGSWKCAAVQNIATTLSALGVEVTILA